MAGWREVQAKPDCQKRAAVRQLGNMRVIPVIDLMNGCVVRGIGGRRSEYRSVKSCIAPDSSPQSIARALVERFAFETVYVADLDSIVHGRFQAQTWKDIASAGLRLWLDAGAGDFDKARRILEAIDQAQIEADVVVGLESVGSEEDLGQVGQMCAARRIIFSLDMQGGQPLVRNSAWRNATPLDLVAMANAADIYEIIILDLADVGTGQGTRTLDLCRQIRQSTGTKTIIAGGGVRGVADLEAMAEAGCNAALVASALHDGRLTPDDIRRIENRPH